MENSADDLLHMIRTRFENFEKLKGQFHYDQNLSHSELTPLSYTLSDYEELAKKMSEMEKNDNKVLKSSNFQTIFDFKDEKDIQKVRMS